MDLNRLAVFVAVAQASGVSAAAKKLGLPKSSVSRALASLEAELGVQLVLRTTRQVSLSTAGLALYERVAPQLAALQSTVSELPEREAMPSGLLRVTAPVDFGVMVLADVVARFTARYPAVEVEVQLSNALVDLIAERFDVAIRFSSKRMKDSSLVARSVGSDPLHLYASPQYLARRGTPRAPSELSEHAWVAYRGLDGFVLRGPTGSARVAARSRVHADDMMFLAGLARAGAGIALLPSFLAEPDVLSGALVRLLPRWTVPSAQAWIVTPTARNVPAKVTAFRDFVIEALEARPISTALSRTARTAS